LEFKLWDTTLSLSVTFEPHLPLAKVELSYSTFGYDEFMKNPVDVPEKYISETNLLVNLKYFLERIVPAALESGVTLAMHPDDPPIPEPLGGAARILSTLDHFGAAVQVATE